MSSQEKTIIPFDKDIKLIERKPQDDEDQNSVEFRSIRSDTYSSSQAVTMGPPPAPPPEVTQFTTPKVEEYKSDPIETETYSISIFRKVSLYDRLSDQCVALAELVIESEEGLARQVKLFDQITGIGKRKSIRIIRAVKESM